MTDKEKIAIYSEFLISLHTARWTGNNKRMAELIENAGAYSYARTNSNGDEDHEELMREETLKNLLNRREWNHIPKQSILDVENLEPKERE